jgi:outer membrane protein TolC
MEMGKPSTLDLRLSTSVARFPAGAVLLGLLAFEQALAAEAALVFTPRQIVAEALAHSPRLRILDQEIAAAEARHDQARAQGLPHLSADAKATSYAGPEDSQLGPLVTIPFIENRYGAGVTLEQPLLTGGKTRNSKAVASHQKRAAQHDRRSAEADRRRT